MDLHVRSGEDEIQLFLNSDAKTAGAAQLNRAIAIARSVLAYLASPVTALPPSQIPRYASYTDPCQLLPTAAVTRYLPGTAVNQGQPSTTLQTLDTCSWSTADTSRTLQVKLDIYGFVAGSLGSEPTFQGDLRAGQGPAVTGQQPVTGLGDQATAIYQFNGIPHKLALVVRSSNAEIQVSYATDQFPGGPPLPSRAAQLATAIAIARDILAALPKV